MVDTPAAPTAMQNPPLNEEPATPPLLEEPNLLEEPTLDDGSGLANPAAPAPSAAAPSGPPAKLQDASAGDILLSALDPWGNTRAALAGAAQGLYAAKDFVTGGEVPEAQRGDTRKAIDKYVKDQGVYGGLVSGVSQFAIGMLGVGKLAAAAKIPGAATTVGSSIKAAVVGSTFFDPHAGNIANLVQSVPALTNPVTQFLSVTEKDGEALARAKNALASIGVDVAVQSVFAAGLRVAKAVRGGDKAGIEAAQADLMKAVEDEQRYRKPPASANDNLTNPSSPRPVPNSIGPEDRTQVTNTRYTIEQPGEPVQPTTPVYPQEKGAEAFRQDNIGPSAPGEPAPSPSGGAASDRVHTNVQYTVGEAPKPGAPADVQGGVDVRAVQSARAGAQGADGAVLPSKPKLAPVSDEQVASLIAHARADSEALMVHGSWDNAIDAGHRFGNPEATTIPWQRLTEKGGDNPQTALDAFVVRVAEMLKADLEKAKGVGTDVRNDGMVNQRVALWNEDPAALLGMLQAAGKDATQLRANMDASFLVGQKVMQDAYTMAARINAGYLEEFGGSRTEALKALTEQIELAATAYANGNAMSANAGRALRGNRSEFRLRPDQLEALRSANPEVMLKILGDTKGDPKALVQALQPALWEPGGVAHWASKFGEAAQYLLVNNLLSNVMTSVVNTASNVYSMTVRPMERIVGSLAQERLGLQAGKDTSSSLVRAESLRQYTYMVGNLTDSFRSAVKAFNAGDSLLSPHSVEVTPAGQGSIGQTLSQLPFKPFDNVPNVLYNALLAAGKTIGLPTRFLGFQDELVKQITYRSKVMAEAHVDGIRNGLHGDELTQHVNQALFDAFDTAGRATNPRILQEAKVASFQQDLVETGSFGWQTIGKSIHDMKQNTPGAGIILPFVKTPVNLFRNGVKLTPGLNMLQQEYRQMLSGKMGPEEQAQAIGQMAMGSLFMGTIASLAYTGHITGGGPSDAKAKRQLQDAGWQPYSFVLKNQDGTTTYVKYGRYDPLAAPLGMAADIMDVLMHPDPILSSKAKPMMEALATSMLKSMTDKLYLQNMVHTIEMITDPDKKFWKAAGGYAAGYVPLSAALRFANPDPYLREARTFIDRVKQGIPGFSESVPVKRDFAGEPITVHKGLWVTDGGSKVDAEMRRMASEQGITIGPPPTTAHGGVDLRQITMKDGKNAYDTLQELSAQPAKGMPRLKDALAQLIETPAYHKAPDGATDDAGTKASILTTLIGKYRSAATKQVSADPNVSKAMYERQLKTAAAYSAQSPSPTPANEQSKMLDSLGKSFGVDMHALTGAAGANPPAPLPPGAKIVGPQ